MAEAAFSEDGKYYSAISQDGRLRIWDTETNVLKQEYTPDLHLTSPPSCLQWLSVSVNSGSSQKGGKRKSSVSEHESQCIALGTATGKILLYSVAQAKVETVLEEKNIVIHNSKITALDWSRKYGLYSCNKDNKVYEWDLRGAVVRDKYNINVDNKGKSSGVNAIKVIPHSQQTPARYIVTASWLVQIWRLHDGEATVIRHLRHSTSPNALLTLTVVNDDCWLLEGSQTERLLSFHDVTITDTSVNTQNGDPPQKRKKVKPSVTTPMYNFVLEDAPRVVDVSVSEDRMLNIVAATRSGVVHYYGHVLNGSSTKPLKPSVTIQVTTAEAEPLPLLACRLPLSSSNALLLGYKSETSIVFEKVTPDLKTKTQVLIRGEAKETKRDKKAKQSNDVNKVRSDVTAADVTYVEPMGGVSRKRAEPGAQVEVPMEARLANLSLDVKGRSQAVSHNLSKLLVQGLHSLDKGIIQTVLQKDSASVASCTVAGLPADYVPQLLGQLADMATKKTSQCSSVCTWLCAVLRSHAALLLATSSNQSDHLTHLLAIFTNRRSHLCQLLNLKGRLQMTMAQRAAKDHAHETQEPILSYNDDTSSEEEMEAEQYESDSAVSWGSAPEHGGPRGPDSDSGD